MVDRIARQALRQSAPKPDLLTDGFPFEPGGWNIVVEAIEPRTISDGGIEVVDVSQLAESIQMTIARVLKCGPAAMEGTTTSGIKLCNFLEGIQSPADLIGKFVVYQMHTGQELMLRRTGQKIRILKVTDLLGVTSDPNAWKFYI
jgi:hypothetical protein